MRSKQFLGFVSRGFAVVAVSVILASGVWAASKEKVLYAFTGANNGLNQAALLAFDSSGNAYGTTAEGGTAGLGTVFKLTPHSNGKWTETVLHNFSGGSDGKAPHGGVTLYKGSLYGTAVAGGSGGACTGDGCGTVFKLTRSGSSFSVLYNFTGGKDGFGPGGGVVFDKKGNLYGTTPDGGKANGCAGQGCGVVYQLAPTKGGGWREKAIHTFTGGSDGATGSLGLLHFDKAGNIYGAAELGGDKICGCGTIFKLSATSTGRWRFSRLYAFTGTPDGNSSYGGLIADATGSLYGTTYFGGANGQGSVFQLTRGSNGKWTNTILYSFQGSTDGGNPTSTLIFDANGNLYGTATAGGANGDGVVFKLTHGFGGFTQSVVHDFGPSPDGSIPFYGLVRHAGKLYSTTSSGGRNGGGIVFEITP